LAKDTQCVGEIQFIDRTETPFVLCIFDPTTRMTCRPHCYTVDVVSCFGLIFCSSGLTVAQEKSRIKEFPCDVVNGSIGMKRKFPDEESIILSLPDFNPSTRISYELKNDAQVSLAIFDITGREISRLVDQYQSKGTYAATWNSSENRWGQLASGTYFARLQVEDKVATRKMLLTK
jgi:hypothetical protein